MTTNNTLKVGDAVHRLDNPYLGMEPLTIIEFTEHGAHCERVGHVGELIYFDIKWLAPYAQERQDKLDHLERLLAICNRKEKELFPLC